MSLLTFTLLASVYLYQVSACESSCSLNNGWCSTSTGYDAASLGIVQAGGTACLPGGTIPPNDFRCFKHRSCSNNCRLKSWSKNHPLMTVSDNNSQTTVYLKSPRFPYKNYRNSDVCVYSVSLSGCTTNTARISYDSFDVNTEDYVQVIYSNNVGPKKYGTDVEGTNELIGTTNFLVVFFSDKADNNNGFEIRTQCG